MRRILPFSILLLLAGCGGGQSPAPSAAPAPESSHPPAPRERASETLGVTATTLNVRAAAKASAAVVGRLERGDKVEVLERAGEWVRVRLSTGVTGWVAAAYLGDDAAVAAAAASQGSRRVKPSERRASGNAGCNSDFRFITTPTPRFSDSGGHGLVVVEGNVNARGNVTSTRVVTNQTGDPGLGKLAEAELKSAKFEAPRRNCVALAFIFTYKRSF
jgi:outer membrane biosynthesis protein TonB